MSRKIKITFLSVVLICGLCGATAAFSLPIYTGVDMGYVRVSPEIFGETSSGGGLEITPYIGISPISSLPDLSFELDLALSFPSLSYSYPFIPGDPNRTLSSMTQFYIVSPQLFAVYTVDKWFIKPFAGVGIGCNINNCDNTNGMDLSNSFSFAAKAGAKVFIPRTSIFLGGAIKFNLNQSETELAFEDIDLNLNAWSFNVSFGYKFK